MSLPLHPRSGLHYAMVMPDDVGAYIDYWIGYSALAATVPWLSVVSRTQYSSFYEAHRNDPSMCFVLWNVEYAPRPRQAIVFALYVEAVGDERVLLADHVRHWHTFGKCAPDFDGVLVHTPSLVAPLARGMSLPTFVFPAGWSPAWGSSAPAKRWEHLLYWGSTVGRREKIIPWLKYNLHPYSLRDASGCFGRKILGEIDQSRASLYVAHSDVLSFSTWRLWQQLATTTPLIAETIGETWPFVAGDHFLPVDPIKLGPSDTAQRYDVAKQIVRHMGDDEALRRVVVRSHADLRERFTIERCVEDYLVEASNVVAMSTVRGKP